MIYTSLTKKKTQPLIYQIYTIISSNKELDCFIILFAKFPSAQKLSVVIIITMLRMPLLSCFLVHAPAMAGLLPSLPLSPSLCDFTWAFPVTEPCKKSAIPLALLCRVTAPQTSSQDFLFFWNSHLWLGRKRDIYVLAETQSSWVRWEERHCLYFTVTSVTRHELWELGSNFNCADTFCNSGVNPRSFTE